MPGQRFVGLASCFFFFFFFPEVCRHERSPALSPSLQVLGLLPSHWTLEALIYLTMFRCQFDLGGFVHPDVSLDVIWCHLNLSFRFRLVHPMIAALDKLLGIILRAEPQKPLPGCG